MVFTCANFVTRRRAACTSLATSPANDTIEAWRKRAMDVDGAIAAVEFAEQVWRQF